MVVDSSHAVLTDFSEVARLFCDWAEKGSLTSEQAQQHLADLHACILRVQLLTPEGEGDCEDFLTNEDWKRIYNRFQTLEPHIYRNVYDPLEDQPGVDIAPLADDLADIYRDVKEGLVLFDRGLFEEAIWQWRYNFQIHWGRHLTAALTALHAHTAGPLRL